MRKNNDKRELNLYVHDVARVLHETVYGDIFHSRYLGVLERTVFAIIRKQRALGIPNDDILTFITHFLGTPRERAESHMNRLDELISAARPA